MRIFLFSLFTALFFISQLTQASVVLTGTRIIYPAPLKEKTLHFSNQGQHPYLVQLNVEDNTPDNKNSDAFIALPNIFRIEPGKAQSVRLIYTGSNASDDKEQMSLLSFSQLPAVNTDKSGANQLILAVTSKVKIFYRPQALSGTPAEVAARLTFSQQGKHLMVSNPTGYYAVIRSASLSLNSRTLPLADSVMLSPGASAKWPLPASIARIQGHALILSLVNDYGVDIRTERPL
ncbi:molecular chaperone [Klebsiella sp. R445]